MAKITSGSEEKVFRISKWLGLNENPDGDTRLKLGEAAVMRNFKITRDGSLQKRPGLGEVMFLGRKYYLTETEEEINLWTEGDLSAYDFLYVNDDSGVTYLGMEIEIDPTMFEEAHFSTDISANITMSSKKPYRVIAVEDIGGRFRWKWTARRIDVAWEEFPVSVQTLWSGYVGGKTRLVGVANNCLIELHDGENFVFNNLGKFAESEGNLSLFGFNDMLYIVHSEQEGGSNYGYYAWNGNSVETDGYIYPIEGYEPVIATNISPFDGATPSGILFERINLLTDLRRVWLTPESGKSNLFVLPEICTIWDVTSRITGDSIFDYTVGEYSNQNGTFTCITFSTETTFLEDHVGNNTIEVLYSASAVQKTGLNALYSEAGEISVEQYNGTTDNRIFLCCSKSNKVYYSGLDRNGQPRADYFPDMNEIAVGESSDNVTGLIRHYSRLIVYKANSTYSIQYGTIGLADGTTTAAFYCTPVNKRIGNEAFGQVRLVLNSPRTLHGKDLYEWRNNSSYSSNLTVDERQAKRISDRIHETLASFDVSKCYCYDDNDNQEYYICFDKKALVHNYAADAWYYYDNFDVTCMANFGGELYAGDSHGRLNLVSRTNRTDNGDEITAYWESGSEAFGKEFMRKYSSTIWVTLKPENRSRVVVTAVTDRNGNLEEDVLSPPLAEYTVAASLSTFSDADFRAWSFNTSRVPKIFRSKLKAKKFVYYKLIFKMDGTNTTATIVSADIKVRFTGQAR